MLQCGLKTVTQRQTFSSMESVEIVTRFLSLHVAVYNRSNVAILLCAQVLQSLGSAHNKKH